MKFTLYILILVIYLPAKLKAQNWTVIRNNPYGNVYGSQSMYVDLAGYPCYDTQYPTIYFEHDKAGNRILRYVEPALPLSKVKKGGMKDMDVGNVVQKFGSEKN